MKFAYAIFKNYKEVFFFMHVFPTSSSTLVRIKSKIVIHLIAASALKENILNKSVPEIQLLEKTL